MKHITQITLILSIFVTTGCTTILAGAQPKRDKSWSNVKYESLEGDEYAYQVEIDSAECYEKSGMSAVANAAETEERGMVGVIIQARHDEAHKKAVNTRTKIYRGCMLSKGWRPNS